MARSSGVQSRLLLKGVGPVRVRPGQPGRFTTVEPTGRRGWRRYHGAVRILGISKAITVAGKTIRDGGAAIYDSGQIIALTEAGITGRKHAGGYQAALAHLSGMLGLDVEKDFDFVAVSTCCEPESLARFGHPLASHDRLCTVNHHRSHASLAFYASGFKDALVVVADGGGNTLSPGPYGGRWWEEPREQFSCYVGTEVGLELIGRDFEQPSEVGLAELYRAFTYFLGWHSYVYASRTMALAGLGNRMAYPGEPFSFDGERLGSLICNEPLNPVAMVPCLAEHLGIDFGCPRAPGAVITQRHCDVAAFIQHGIETALRRKLTYLARQTGLTRLCLAGGIALNVVMNGQLHDIFPGGVYVPCAPGDDGQSLGNAYAVLSTIAGAPRPAMRTSRDACRGPDEDLGSARIARVLASRALDRYVVYETADFPGEIAAALAGGAIVCLFGARSEFGPRALGTRSILADPRSREVVSVLALAKDRPDFLPFGPVMLSGSAGEYFHDHHASPFMSFAFPVRPSAVPKIPAVVHADGTARVQFVEDGDDGVLARILRAFGQRTGVPVLLNTSLNLGGRPMAGTAEQAVEAFAQLPSPVLGIGRFVIVKPEHADRYPGGVRALPPMFVRKQGQQVDLGSAESIAGALRRAGEETESVVFVRQDVPLYTPYLDWLKSGRKHTTIRFRRGGIEVPARLTLPLAVTPDFRARQERTPGGWVRVGAVRYARFGDLTDVDARNDGFGSLAEMRQGLTRIYECLRDGDWVTVFEISYLEAAEEGE